MSNNPGVDTIKELETTWSLKMADFESRLKNASTSSCTSVSQLYEEFSTFKDLVSNMISILKKQIQDCTRQVDTMDMAQRRNILLFHGISESPEVSEESAVLDILNRNMGLPHITSSAFKRCHRLGLQGGKRPHAVLVHFRDHETKSQVWKSKSKLKGSGTILAEFLTRTRQSIQKKARAHFGLRNVWTHDGVIYIKVPGGAREKISTEEELASLIVKFPMLTETGRTEVAPSSSSYRPPETRRKQATTALKSDDGKQVKKNQPKK